MQPSPTTDRHVSLREGERPIPGFRLIRRRGRGGFGEVWEAEAAGGFRVALKFVRLSGRARAAELRALHLVRGIHHPNLLTTFGSWLVDDLLIIGMELADRSLWDRHVEATTLGYRGVGRNELLGYLGEVAAGVDHLNENHHVVDGRPGVGVQHRDLKPPNILLFGGGAKVGDLGMARALEGEVGSHTGTWTCHYAAPEFFDGTTTRHSDQYSLAVTYCQLRGGRLPFVGSGAAVMAGHLFNRPDLDALPEPERPIVERALAKSPEDRWSSCRAFLDALRAIPAGAVDDLLVDPDAGVGGFDPAGSSVPSTLGNGSAASGSMDSWHVDHALATGSSGPDVPAWLATDGPAITATTLILPAAPTPDPARRPARGFRRACAMTATALAVVVLATRTPGRPVVGAPGARHAEDLAPEPEGPPPPLEPPTPRPLPSPPAEAEPAVEVEAPTGSAPLPVVAKPPIVPTLYPDEPTLPAAAGRDVERLPAINPPAPAEPAGEVPATGAPTGAVAADSLTGPADDTVRRVAAAAAAELAPEPSQPSGPAPGPLPVAGPVGPIVSHALARGRDLYRRGSFAAAVAEFDAALRLDPGDVASRHLRALARHRSGDPAAALPDYAEVTRVRPDEVNAHISRGQAYHDVGDFARAIASYDEAIRRRPGDVDAHFRRGMARYRAGDYEGAGGDFAAALRLDGSHPYAAEFRNEAQARRDAQLAQRGGRAATTPRPTTAAAEAPVVAGSRAPVRPTGRVAEVPASPARGPAARSPAADPATKQTAVPQQPDRRRPTLRRLVPWPLAKPR